MFPFQREEGAEHGRAQQPSRGNESCFHPAQQQRWVFIINDLEASLVQFKPPVISPRAREAGLAKWTLTCGELIVTGEKGKLRLLLAFFKVSFFRERRKLFKTRLSRYCSWSWWNGMLFSLRPEIRNFGSLPYKSVSAYTRKKDISASQRTNRSIPLFAWIS